MGGAYPDLSPGLRRTGRAAVWTEHGGRVLMACQGPHHTLPGGGIEPGETAEQAAVREAWEETGAVVELTGGAFLLRGRQGGVTQCFPARLLRQEDSPEGRPHLWVDPTRLPWAADEHLRQELEALGRTPARMAVPPGVRAARQLAARLGSLQGCSPQTGRLLRQLAACRPSGRLLELGSGCGEGAAWLLSGMNADARLTTAETDRERARAVAALFAQEARVAVMPGDGWPLLEHGPYDLIFADCAASKGEGERLDALVRALRPGGTLVMDHFTPHDRLTGELAGRLSGGDPLREAVFCSSRLTALEVRVSDGESALLATRTT